MYVIEEPKVEPRLQKRYKKLVRKHVAISQSVATGAHKAAKLKDSFAAAVGASRFYNNPRVSLPQLAEPLIKSAQLAVKVECRDYALVVHDWSDLKYSTHESKSDRAMLSKETELGYELQTSLVVSDCDGAPLAPVYLGLRADDGVHSTRREDVLPVRAGLDELGRTINHIESLGCPKSWSISSTAKGIRSCICGAGNVRGICSCCAPMRFAESSTREKAGCWRKW